MIVKNNKEFKKNKKLISNKFDIFNFKLSEFKEGWAVIKDLKTNKYGWINEDYTKLIKPIFDLSWNFQEGFGVFKKNGTEGWIDTSGKVLAEGFLECSFFKEGFAIFKRDDKYGWINSEGIVLTEGFDCCYDFQEGFAVFKKNNKYGWMDTSGNILIDDCDECYFFEEGFGRFKKDNKKGWIDKDGNIYTKKPY